MDLWVGHVTKPGPFAGQTLRAGFAAENGSVTRQPREETGEQIPDPPPQGTGLGHLRDKEAGGAEV